MVYKWNRGFLKKVIYGQGKQNCSKLNSYEHHFNIIAVDNVNRLGVQPFFYFRNGRLIPLYRGSQL